MIHSALLLLAPMCGALLSPRPHGRHAGTILPSNPRFHPVLLLAQQPQTVSGNNTESFDVNSAAAGIRKELYARDPDVQAFVGRAERRRRGGAFDAETILERASSIVRVDAAYLVLALGAFLIGPTLLNILDK